MNFFKSAKHSKFAVKCDRIIKNSQKTRKGWAVLGKKMGFPIKKVVPSETAEGSKFAVECD